MLRRVTATSCCKQLALQHGRLSARGNRLGGGAIHQRRFSLDSSLFQDWVLLPIGVGAAGVIGSYMYLYLQLSRAKDLNQEQAQQLSRANESLQSTRMDLNQEQALHKMTKEETNTRGMEIRRLKDLIELQKTADLGQMGEGVLENLLEKAMHDGLIDSFKLQPRNGNLVPDAVATLSNGRTLIIDSKAADKTQMDETDAARMQYTKNLKVKMTNLSKKGYTSAFEQSYNTVWMLLPHDRDLQRAYSKSDILADDYNIHKHAEKHNIQLVGPESFLSSMRTLHFINKEQDQLENQQQCDPSTLLGPKWIAVVKKLREVEDADKKRRAQHNMLVAKTEEYHVAAQKVLGFKSLAKRSLAKGLDEECLDTRLTQKAIDSEKE